MIVKELKKELKVPKLNFCVPINLKENIDFNFKQGHRITKRRKFDIPSEPGVYIFFNSLMEIMYIGKSINLKMRFGQHMSASNGSGVYKAIKENEDNIVYYSYAICKDDYEANMYEMMYTYLYKPKLNNIKQRTETAV